MFYSCLIGKIISYNMEFRFLEHYSLHLSSSILYCCTIEHIKKSIIVHKRDLTDTSFYLKGTAEIRFWESIFINSINIKIKRKQEQTNKKKGSFLMVRCFQCQMRILKTPCTTVALRTAVSFLYAHKRGAK